MTTIPDSICKSHAQATCDFWETSAPFALSLVQLRSSTKRVYSLSLPKRCKQSSSFCFRSCPCPAHPQTLVGVGLSSVAPKIDPHDDGAPTNIAESACPKFHDRGHDKGAAGTCMG